MSLEGATGYCASCFSEHAAEMVALAENGDFWLAAMIYQLVGACLRDSDVMQELSDRLLAIWHESAPNVNTDHEIRSRRVCAAAGLNTRIARISFQSPTFESLAALGFHEAFAEFVSRNLLAAKEAADTPG